MKRPFSVTLTMTLVLLLAVWNAIRTITSIQWRNTLNEYTPISSFVFSTTFGVIWLITSVVLLFGIWQKKPWNAKLLIGAAAAYTVWVWGGRLTWQTPAQDTGFTIIINAACLILTYFTSKSLTREAYERDTKNPEVE